MVFAPLDQIRESKPMGLRTVASRGLPGRGHKRKTLKSKAYRDRALEGDLPIFRQGPTRKILMMVVPRKGAVDRQPTQKSVLLTLVSGLARCESVCVGGEGGRERDRVLRLVQHSPHRHPASCSGGLKCEVVAMCVNRHMSGLSSEQSAFTEAVCRVSPAPFSREEI